MDPDISATLSLVRSFVDTCRALPSLDVDLVTSKLRQLREHESDLFVLQLKLSATVWERTCTFTKREAEWKFATRVESENIDPKLVRSAEERRAKAEGQLLGTQVHASLTSAQHMLSAAEQMKHLVDTALLCINHTRNDLRTLVELMQLRVK